MTAYRDAQAKMRGILSSGFVTCAQYAECVECVRLAEPDDDIAHSMQDELIIHALRDIANSGMPGSDAQGVAKAVLEVLDVDFSRWCA